MAEHDAGSAPKKLSLPVTVAGPGDVGRLILELENINETLLQLGLRKAGDEVKMPKTSSLMDQTVETNKLNLLHDTDRVTLQHFLTDIKQRSPVLHISFSADPSPAFTAKLMTWLRREIHPFVLLSVGLQPTIAAGCIVRTTNKQFDFSLRQDFLNKRDLLISQLAAKQAAEKSAPEEAAA
jgi:F0F1-type ATP synthase delta subunit